MENKKKRSEREQIDDYELQQIVGGVFSGGPSNMLAGFGAASFNATLMMSGIMSDDINNQSNDKNKK